VKNFFSKSIGYVGLGIILLFTQLGYAENTPVYFIGLQSNLTNTAEQSQPFVYICTPLGNSVPPPYVCAPTSVPTVSQIPSPQSPMAYPQTLQSSNSYNYNYSNYLPQYRHLGGNAQSPYLPKYRPENEDESTDFIDNYQSTLHQTPSHSRVSSQPSPDSWSPTSNFISNHSAQNYSNKSNYSPVYHQNPYAHNLSNNVWQNAPQYRPDKTMPSSAFNPFNGQPVYQGEINYQYFK